MSGPVWTLRIEYRQLTASKSSCKRKYGEADFQKIVSDEQFELESLDIKQDIITNRNSILDFWSSLSEEGKSGFTIFELNIILFQISKQYKKYQKQDKKE